MAVDGYLKFNTKIDTKGFNVGTKQISNAVTGMKSLFGKLGTAVSSAFAVKGIIDFGKQAIETASDIQEVQNVVDVSFGKMKSKMEEFADSAVETYGISKLTAKQTGSTYMAMAKGMQIADDAASDMAVTLTGLSADMASFYNKEQSATATALNSVFTGETETLKTYGIVMTEANLQQFAYTQGINKKISAMSQAEKVQLRYNYVLSQTALAQGDFARTSDGWANQIRILSEQWKEFSGTVGTILINTLLPAIQTLNKAMSWLNIVVQEVLATLSAIFGWEIDINDAVSSSVDAQNALTEAINSTVEAKERELASFDKINKLSDNEKSSGAGAGSGSSIGSSEITTIDVDTSGTEKKLTDLQQKLSDFISSMTLTFNDVFVEWEDISGEQLAEKIITAIGALVGGVIGFSIGGVPGAIVGAITGMGVSLAISSLTFDHDGELSSEEILSSLTMALTGLVGGIIGFSIGGVAGATIGVTLGAALGLAINEVSFDTDGELTGEEITEYVITALGTVAGGIIGFSLGGPAGAAIGMALGTALTLSIAEMSFDDDGELNADEITGLIVSALCGIAGGVIGFAVGGPAGAVVGASIGLGLSMLINKIDWAELWTDISTGFTSILTKIKEWLSKQKTKFEETWKNFTSCVKDKTAQMKANIVTKTNEFKLAWKQRADIVADKTAEMKLKFSETVSDIRMSAKQRYDAITNTFSSIPNWFRDKFSEAWTKVKNVFSSGGKVFDGIKDGILNGLKTVINSLISGINRVIATPFNGINTALRRVRDISIAGVQPFKNRISLINVPQIPRLATGTVVPANYGEFLAVLGDNKRETEVVSPLSTMKQALAEVLASSDGNGDINVVVTLDGDVVYKNVVKKNKQNTKRTGVNALAG